MLDSLNGCNGINWDTLVKAMKTNSACIRYKHLCCLAFPAEPPEGVAFLFGYVSILLGIEPTWSAAKRSMFKQLQPLLKFMHEVRTSSFVGFSLYTLYIIDLQY